MDIIRRFGFIGAACFFMACSHQNAQKPADEPIQAFCIDFNWSGKGYAGLSLPERTILRQILKNILNGTRLMV